MRKHLIPSFILVLSILAVQPVWADSITVQWNPNSETDLAGYRLYYGNQSRTDAPYPETVVINNTAATSWEIEIQPGTYFLALTAFDTSGNESDFSNEVQYVTPSLPGKPGKPILMGN